MNNGNYSQRHHTESRPNPKSKKGMPSKAMMGPLVMIAPQDLPKQVVQVQAGQKDSAPSMELPDGTYSSLVQGPSYGKQYVMPEDQQFTEYDTPGFFEKDGTGEQILDTIGDAATDVYDWGRGAVNTIGGFFSSLFGGGDEEKAKQIMKQKIAKKLQERQQSFQNMPATKMQDGRIVPILPEVDKTQVLTTDRIR